MQKENEACLKIEGFFSLLQFPCLKSKFKSRTAVKDAAKFLQLSHPVSIFKRKSLLSLFLSYQFYPRHPYKCIKREQIERVYKCNSIKYFVVVDFIIKFKNSLERNTASQTRFYSNGQAYWPMKNKLRMIGQGQALQLEFLYKGVARLK